MGSFASMGGSYNCVTDNPAEVFDQGNLNSSADAGATAKQSQDCAWKYASKVHQLNPNRWSKTMSFATAINELEIVKRNGDRPITLKFQDDALAKRTFEKPSEAVAFLSLCALIA